LGLVSLRRGKQREREREREENNEHSFLFIFIHHGKKYVHCCAIDSRFINSWDLLICTEELKEARSNRGKRNDGEKLLSSDINVRTIFKPSSKLRKVQIKE
jgi:hypothetical protein